MEARHKHVERRLKEMVLAEMRRPEYKPASVRDLQRRLKVKHEDHGIFKRILRQLLNDEEIVRAGPHQFAVAGARPAPSASAARPASSARTDRPAGRGSAPQARAARPGGGAWAKFERTARPAAGGSAPGGTAVSARPAAPDAPRPIIGQIQINPRGFGFVTPDGGGRDIFIPPPGIGERRDGDRVEVRVVREQSDGRREGEIVRLVEATRRRVVGVYRVEAGRGASGGVLDAYDRRYEGGVVIPDGENGGAVSGLMVGVEIIRPPQEGSRAVGRVVEILGPAESPETDLKAVIAKYGLRNEFPPDVMAEAARAADTVGPAELEGREDFRGLPIVTIDGETAMDFDDAVMVRKNADGTYELQVHIADVAHYVKAMTALDREAFERATSVYFPGTALPMLPHRLSNGICSLNPGVDRLVQSCLMTIDGAGTVVSYRLCEGIIKSAARMTYTKVARILTDNDAELLQQYAALVPGFRLMEELCGVLNRQRVRRGSIDFDLPEPEVILAATGEMTGILALQRNIAHRLIEEFMLAANETVARHLFKARVPAIYRIHERPDPRRLEDFDAMAHAFGYSLPRPFTSIEPKAFQAILDRASGRPEEHFLSRLMLRSMKQARYSEKRDIHFGLASTCYTHFTSPIRRYPDLIVHRLVKRLLRGGPLQPRERGDLETFLPEAAARSSFRERTADSAENELIERKKVAFMGEKIGEEFDGFVSRVEAFGFFVELRDLFVEGLVPIESLPKDRYHFDERRRVLRGERSGRVFGLGDAARVRLDKVSAARLEIDFALLSSTPGPRMAGAAAPHRPMERQRHERHQKPGRHGGGGRGGRQRQGAATGHAATGHAAPRHGRRQGGQKNRGKRRR